MDRFTRWAVCLSLPMVAVLAVLFPFAKTASSEPADVDQLIAEVRGVSSEQARWSAAQDLAVRISQIVDEGQSDTIGDDTIAALVDFLQDRNEAGDFWIVGALGYIGGRAGRAVPVLEIVYSRACADQSRADQLRGVVLFGIQMTDIIAYALARITDRTPDCRGWRRQHL